MKNLRVNIEIKEPLPLKVCFESGANIIGVWGDSGVGKSSLLRAVSGWNKSISGDVEKNKVIWNSSNNEVSVQNRELFLISQSNGLIPQLTVLKNLKLSPYFSHDQIDDDLTKLLDQKVSQLSGGETKKVLIQQALFCNPKLLILDESFSGFDLASFQKWSAKIIEYSKREGVQVLITSHNLFHFLELVDEVLWLKEKPQYFSKKRSFVDDLNKCENQKSTLYISKKAMHSKSLNEWDLEGESLLLPKEFLVGQTEGFIQLKSNEVSISKNFIEGISIRNQLKVGVLEVETRANNTVLLKLALGRQVLLAEISRDALEEIEIRPNQAVYALFKANIELF